MKSPRLLWSLTLGMPLLLAWVVFLGELNRGVDHTPGVHVRMIATRVNETPFTAPKLVLRNEFLDPQPVGSDFRAGEDVYLRFTVKEGRWVFDRARKRIDEQRWSATVIDVPGRVVIDEGGQSLKANPLLPSSFAISRSMMRRLRQETLLDVNLHKGAFGTIWMSDVFESALPLGNVVAILGAPRGRGPLAIGEVTEGVAGPYISTGNGGWMAPIEQDQVGISTKIDGRPMDAIRLDSTLAIAAQPASQVRRFSVQVGEKQASYDGTFLSFDADGSFWSIQADPFPSGERRKLIKRNLDGSVQQQTIVPETIAAASGNAMVTTVGYEVRRYTIDHSRLQLTDSWTIEGLTATCSSTPNLVAAAGNEGVFILTSGDRSPKRIFSREDQLIPASVECNRDGDILAFMRRPESGRNTFISRPAQLHFRSSDGSEVALGEHSLSDQLPDTHGGNRFLRIGDRLYAGGSGEIHVFDTTSGRLLRRIVERSIGEKRRLF